MARLICIVSLGVTYRQIYQTVGNNFLYSKTMPAYLQYGKELFFSWSCHTVLTGILGPDPSPIGHPCDILGRRVHGPAATFPEIEHNVNVFHKWVGVQP